MDMDADNAMETRLPNLTQLDLFRLLDDDDADLREETDAMLAQTMEIPPISHGPGCVNS